MDRLRRIFPSVPPTTYELTLLCRIFPSLSLATCVLSLLCRIYPSRLQNAQQPQQEF